MCFIDLFPSRCRKTLHAIVACAEQNSTDSVDGKMDPRVDSFHVLPVASVEGEDCGMQVAHNLTPFYANLYSGTQIDKENERRTRCGDYRPMTLACDFAVAGSA